MHQLDLNLYENNLQNLSFNGAGAPRRKSPHIGILHHTLDW